jgi:hypothetical protein
MVRMVTKELMEEVSALMFGKEVTHPVLML